MPLIPILRCRSLATSLAFYTQVLDFEPADADGAAERGFVVLSRDGGQLFLSSHAGDGCFGQAVVVPVDDLDDVVRRLRARGFEPPAGRGSPVHEAPVDQTWGTREFYVDDPDGNTIRFTERR